MLFRSELGPFLLALALLVTGVLADHAHHTVAADHLALVTDSFDAGTDFHQQLSIE